ncbi:MAG: hypothetical protein PVF34_07575 [Gammaproteobacteria bacterium]|jgi:hypothetical protein
MIVLVTDPITNKMVTDPHRHPFVIQGSGHNITKIYFESQRSKEQYLKTLNQTPLFT